MCIQAVGAQKILQVCLSEHSLWIFDSSLQALVSPESVHQMCRSSSDSLENSRSQIVSLFGWSAPLRSVNGGRRRQIDIKLAHERFNLSVMGLPVRVIETIQKARAASVRSAYDRKWMVWALARTKHIFMNSVSKPLIRLWNLSVVLNALSRPPFQPIDSSDLKLCEAG